MEKNHEKIEQSRSDWTLEVDPMFIKYSQKFDESGIKGLLTNNLYVIFIHIGQWWDSFDIGLDFGRIKNFGFCE